MQAGVVHAGRYWTTTAATSLKARSVKAHGHATAAIADGDDQRIISGRTVAFRPLEPWSALADPIAAMRWSSAVARLSRTHVGQLFGYLEASGSVPKEWFPTHRVLLVTRIDRSLRLRGHEIVDRRGAWEPERGIDLSAELRPRPLGALPLDALPESHRAIVRAEANAHLGVSTPTGPVALPAMWAGDDHFTVSASALAAVTADANGRATAVFDKSDRRRPDEKLGVMFRGSMSLVDLEGDEALVALDTERVTTWDGFNAETVDVGAPAAA